MTLGVADLGGKGDRIVGRREPGKAVVGEGVEIVDGACVSSRSQAVSLLSL